MKLYIEIDLAECSQFGESVSDTAARELRQLSDKMISQDLMYELGYHLIYTERTDKPVGTLKIQP